MRLRSSYEGASLAEVIVAREEKVKQDDFPQNTTAVVPLALPNETQLEALFDFVVVDPHGRGRRPAAPVPVRSAIRRAAP